MTSPILAGVGASLIVGVALSGPGQLTDLERVNLRGITAVSVSVHGIDDDAKKCNLSKENLSLSAGRALLGAGIKVEDGALITAAIRVLVLPVTSGVCVGYVDASVETQVSTSLRFQMTDDGKTPPSTVVFARLWSGGDLVTGPPAGFGDRVSNSVRQRFDDFTAKVKLANPK